MQTDNSMTSLGSKSVSCLVPLNYTVFALFSLVILPVLANLSGNFMTFHEAEMPSLMQIVCGIPVLGWLALTSAGLAGLWLHTRFTTASKRIVYTNSALLVTMTTIGLATAAMLVAPMFSILSALNR